MNIREIIPAEPIPLASTALALTVLALTVLANPTFAVTPGQDPPVETHEATSTVAGDGTEAADQHPPATPQLPSQSVRSGFGAPQQNVDVEAAIHQAIDQGWQDFHLITECQQADGFNTTEIFANGVGIWNTQRQFNVTRDEIQTMLRALRDAEFAYMPVVHQAAIASPKPSSTTPRVQCQIRLRLDATAKRATQLVGGSPAESLPNLAGQLLEISRGPAAAGVGAKHLDDGLEKIARGELAPETLRLMSHLKPSRHEVDEIGWQLELKNAVAQTRSYSPKTGYGRPMRLALSCDDLKDLAGELAAEHPRSLPRHLTSTSLTVIAFELFRHKRRIETTRTGKPGPEIEPHHKQRVERVLKILGRLHQKILDEGESIAPNLAR